MGRHLKKLAQVTVLLAGFLGLTALGLVGLAKVFCAESLISFGKGAGR